MTRQWVDQAKKSGQQLGSGAPDGTFAAGVTRVTELLPVLMNDIIATAPEDQKVCLPCLQQPLSPAKDVTLIALCDEQAIGAGQSIIRYHLLVCVELNSRLPFSIRSKSRNSWKSGSAQTHFPRRCLLLSKRK